MTLITNKYEAKLTQLSMLISIMKRYIDLLNAELSDTVRIASVHGWKSHRYSEGVKMRNEIRQLQKIVDFNIVPEKEDKYE